jgi:hypothetical protein
MSQPSVLTVDRAGETFQLQAGQMLKPGDRISNTGMTPASVGAVSYSAEHPSLLATLKPGASVKVTDVGGPEDEVLGLEALDGSVEIAEASAETAAASEYLITPEVEAVSGLFGAVPLLGGIAGPAAAALGLAALAAGGDDDEATASGGDGTAGGGLGGGAGGGGVDGAIDTLRTGVAGLLDEAGTGLNETPLAPATALTDALADGVNTVADQLAGLTANDPTGLSGLMASTLGQSQPGTADSTFGLSGGLNSLTDGLSDGAAGTPLAGLVDPLSGVLAGDTSSLTGVGSALADIGASLAGDTSPLGPLTTDLLAPIVGAAPASTDAGGLTDLLGAGGDASGIASTAGLPGLDVLTGLIPA